MRELTVRSVLLGVALTFVFTAANVYFGLRVGLTFSTAIPAAVVSMALLRTLGGATIVENNIVQTIGSAAGAVATMVFVLPGFVIVGWWSEIPYWETMLVCATGGILGVMLSVPMRRALVVDSDLPYPEGVAGAEILRVGMADAAGAGENRAGLRTIVLGALAGAGFGLLSTLRLAAGEVSKVFKLGAGYGTLGASLSLGLVAIGHLIGLATGIAMLTGLVTGKLILLPWLSAGVPGEAEEVAATVLGEQVRMIGAGAMAVAALWALVRISGAMLRGLGGIAATARARRGGEAIALTERDLPGGWVLGISAAMFGPILYLVWRFVQGGPLADAILPVLLLALVFIIVVGVFTAVVTGYMAGLVGTSNSPVSGVGILAVLIVSVLIAAMFGSVEGDRAPLIAFALFLVSFVFGIAIVANDNLQDLKTGQLVGSTPWKQQAALIIGVVAGSLVLPPVLQLLANSFGFAGAPGAGPNALAAPQASLFAAIAQGVLGGTLRWDLVALGAGIGVIVVIVDEVLRASGRGKLPPLAVGMGIYLPVTLVLPTVIGTVIGHFWNRMAAGTARPEFTERLGVLLATGLVVGDSLFGLAFAGAVGAVGDPARLAIVGEGFAPIAEWIGIAAVVALLAGAYARTRRRALND
ncbi:OPT family oligopeptide transporter [Novosphingobium sp. TH158]|uniref:OPT family oligopeptide transporter n=1 Tax=Novosphingobium sp. TH158 TaxID=2067455 RepID=UPI000C7C04F7|nr:oligopeptide transporter, OPT family [Novosphingobium sp. TH158]PLK26025.1 oligopeptide transporter, OPT family [Novosphingobium sp. TH158]